MGHQELPSEFRPPLLSKIISLFLNLDRQCQSTSNNSSIMSKATPRPKPTRQKNSTIDVTKRKRELDRIAQRNCRERTKNRIAFLEGKLKSLETRNQSNHEYDGLVTMQEKLLHDNSEMRAAMRKILFIADSLLNTPETKCEYHHFVSSLDFCQCFYRVVRLYLLFRL